MKYEKAGDVIYAINSTDTVIGYIIKDRFGTHGHWRGYRHFLRCPERDNKLIWAGINKDEIYPGTPAAPFEPWTEPTWFANVKEFKAYYDSKE